MICADGHTHPFRNYQGPEPQEIDTRLCSLHFIISQACNKRLQSTIFINDYAIHTKGTWNV